MEKTTTRRSGHVPDERPVSLASLWAMGVSLAAVGAVAIALFVHAHHRTVLGQAFFGVSLAAGLAWAWWLVFQIDGRRRSIHQWKNEALDVAARARTGASATDSIGDLARLEANLLRVGAYNEADSVAAIRRGLTSSTSEGSH
jgi:hypothetical protein